MNSPFDNERPLSISPSLAATIGLEEATLLSVLTELAEYRPAQGQGWCFSHEDAQRRLPFWGPLDIERVSKNLAGKGLLHIGSAPFQQGGQLLFHFGQTPAASANQIQHQAQHQSQRQPQTLAGHGIPIVEPQQLQQPRQAMARTDGASLIAPNWQPDNETLQRLTQLNVDQQFALQQVPEFVTYWRDSGQTQRSWGAKFHQQVIRKWRERETFSHSNNKDQMRPIDFNWRPSHEAMEMMTKHAAVDPQFVEDAIPEFILYWNEKGTKANTWNTKFIQHVRRQWARFKATVEHDSEPKLIADNWQPSADVWDILRLANIEQPFAQSLIPEFILYWKEAKQAQSAWNTKFLQHVKYHWAKQHQVRGQQLATGTLSTGTQPRKTRERSLAEDLTDTSW